MSHAGIPASAALVSGNVRDARAPAIPPGNVIPPNAVQDAETEYMMRGVLRNTENELDGVTVDELNASKKRKYDVDTLSYAVTNGPVNLQQLHDTMVAHFATTNAQFATILRLLTRTSNNLKRSANHGGLANTPATPWVPLEVEDDYTPPPGNVAPAAAPPVLGSTPVNQPTNLAQVEAMTTNQLVALGTSFNKNFGATNAARKSAIFGFYTVHTR